ncbi:hypothetical protein Y032_0015g2834 [Ancylostoma ceylanicum]|uniref:Uncharacterized protein n=1 Tax=Ancylostoma ceylanicum TaxID=53326 RepID=A0A016V9U8_9BILA|nr:hypothetical protein Y032_0015g2834 [Ancylostoma ceylanicum]
MTWNNLTNGFPWKGHPFLNVSSSNKYAYFWQNYCLEEFPLVLEIIALEESPATADQNGICDSVSEKIRLRDSIFGEPVGGSKAELQGFRIMYFLAGHIRSAVSILLGNGWRTLSRNKNFLRRSALLSGSVGKRLHPASGSAHLLRGY